MTYQPKYHFITYIFLGLFSIQGLFAQIPSNVRGAPCVNELLVEDFSSTVPIGWEGDWMLLDPPLVEGWNLTMGPTTGTPGTGADGPFSGTHFAYMETSGPAPINSVFKINTPPIEIFDVLTSIRFRVLMHGSGVGSLRVNVLSGPGFTTVENVLEITGEQHATSGVGEWQEAFIDIRSYDSGLIKVEFEGMKGSNGLGDIAIDLVEVCSEPIVPTLGEWGVICLALLVLILGVVGIQASLPETVA